MAEHVYQGACPDETQPNARDANCPACELIVEVGRVEAERDRLILAANSARVLIERHRATRGGSQLLTTALQELDDVLPTYATGESDA